MMAPDYRECNGKAITGIRRKNQIKKERGKEFYGGRERGKKYGNHIIRFEIIVSFIFLKTLFGETGFCPSLLTFTSPCNGGYRPS